MKMIRLQRRSAVNSPQKKYEKEQLCVKFILYIDKIGTQGASYGMSMEIDGNKIHGIENFLECYLKGKEFKFDRYTS